MLDPRHHAPVRAIHARLVVILLLLYGAGGELRDLHTSSALGVPQAGAAPRLDAERLMADLRALSAPDMEGRLAGSPGGRRARAYILGRFREIGLQPVAGSYERTFPLDGGGQSQSREPAVGANVMGMIPGRAGAARLVIVGAHYDHVGVRNGQLYPGADDNASGVAAMLAVAGALTGQVTEASILFVAFDAEEQGLRGARHFVNHPPVDLRSVTAMVNLDMVGRGDANTLVVAGTSYTPSLRAVVADAARGRELAIAFGYDRPSAAGERGGDWTHSSDHGPFHDAGVPFLYFGVENHGDYHKPTDTADKIPAGFYTEVTQVVLDTVRRLAGGERSGGRDSAP